MIVCVCVRERERGNRENEGGSEGGANEERRCLKRRL
jgi:hypothetical protein